jgi:hypothetical protein
MQCGQSKLAIMMGLCRCTVRVLCCGRLWSRMADQFVGYAVSVTCRNDLGAYQGQICNVDSKEQNITLKKAFKNGIPCQVPQVTLR